MKVRRHTTKASHPDARPLENTKYKNICTIEPGRLLKTKKTVTICGFQPAPVLAARQHARQSAEGGANPNKLNGLKSGPDKLLKTNRRNKKDVKNEDCSG
jgi:hypothetical protein